MYWVRTTPHVRPPVVVPKLQRSRPGWFTDQPSSPLCWYSEPWGWSASVAPYSVVYAPGANEMPFGACPASVQACQYAASCAGRCSAVRRGGGGDTSKPFALSLAVSSGVVDSSPGSETTSHGLWAESLATMRNWWYGSPWKVVCTSA